MKHSIRFFGGLGQIILIYGPIRLLEKQPVVFVLPVVCLMAYGLGWLTMITREESW